MLLLHEHATVTICHSKTPDLAAVCREADILVAAIGRLPLEELHRLRNALELLAPDRLAHLFGVEFGDRTAHSAAGIVDDEIGIADVLAN